MNKPKLFFALIATAYFFYYASTPADWHFIDNVNLLIHEAGHWIFWPFGTFMHILGGSLFQTIFPMLYVGYFYIRRDFYSASMLIFWVGQNLVNVSVYASDAVVMRLPLLGGDTSGHDWHALLSMLNLLPYTNAIGSSIYFLGVAVILAAAYFSILYSEIGQQYR
jgi:hypothetical protein